VPVPVADNVPEDLKIWIDEHSADLPGVAAERVAVRNYPYGQLAAHVLGYTGQIIDDEFEEKTGSAKPYTLNDEIGKYGVEKVYEDDLRGTPGSRSIEVDAENHPIRVVE
jgi:penicillin-binding protein 2